MENLPFMATENIMMEAVKRGGNRQELHEKIREYSMQVTREVKLEGKPNALIAKMAADPAFMMNEDELNSLLEPSKYIGRSKEQVEEFIEGYIAPLLAGKDFSGVNVELNV